MGKVELKAYAQISWAVDQLVEKAALAVKTYNNAFVLTWPISPAQICHASFQILPWKKRRD